MKTYFAKYLPVEGEIKEGDTHCLNRQGKIINFVTPISDKIASFANKNGDNKPVKLFLCSRDIQVGDKDVWNNTNQVLEGPITDKDLSAINFFKENAPECPDNQYYKVIGEISPDAIWVKEGDEFDRDELKIWKSCAKHSSRQITEAFGGTWKHEEDSITIPGKVVRVDIKCPTCRKFH